MTTILAIDTSSAYLSLALQVGEKVYPPYIEKVDNKQSENIIPQIKVLLTEAGITASDLTHIAYNQGPGSFTGLRIGLSVALGIAYGINALLIPVPTFAIYALQAYELLKSAGTTLPQVVVGLDARLNQLYFAGVNAETLEYFIQPQLINPGDMALIDKMNMVFIGSGFKQYEDLLPNDVRALLMPNLISPEYPDATYLLKLANSGKFKAATAAQADLLYLRDKVALNLAEQSLNRQDQLNNE
ncbi:MAG TPA: tRNA (adenosine(37)-N6)-threonylcarbamoyltransferase complex dimerization subunit type 1 TsaB [Aquella sp.]|nr:tRNA (adenosine(37)-N6)-threonylcarbamoyltransferase complex dimerization subunit type 1 TsaB [Aquella sp.]